MSGPLDGCRIVDLTGNVTGPLATMILADQGAEVIKVEMPGRGDYVRLAGNGVQGFSAAFLNNNRNKRSIAIDLKTERGREIVLRLAQGADVFVQNFRPGVAERIGVGESAVRASAPDIIYVSISGFGENGPYAERPAYDPIIQALAGYMSITGDKNSPPVKSGVSIIDFAGGFAASLAISAALVEVRSTGLGRDIDVGLFDTSLSMLSYFSSWHLNHGWLPNRTHLSAHQSITPAQNYKTSDGWVTIFCAKEKFWHDMAKTMNLSHLLNDPRFKTFDDRKNNRQLLNEIIEPLIVQKPTSYWVKLFLNKVPCAPVRSLPEALNDPLIKSRDMIIENNHPLRGVMRHVKSPFITDGANANVGPAPRLGQNTNEIMLELLGYKKSHVSELRRSGVII